MLASLLQVKNIYVNKRVIEAMLKDPEEDKKLCAIIVILMCNHQVPI